MALRQIRVAVIGAQGVGKSTLASELHRKCEEELPYRCELVKGIGQSIRDRGLNVGVTGDIETKIAFLAAHLERERTSTGEVVIFDRCNIDVLAYVDTIGTFSKNFEALVDELFQLTLASFSLLIYLPIPTILRGKAAPHETPEFRESIDRYLRDSQSRFPAKIYQIVNDPDSRVDEAFSLVQVVLKRHE